MTESSELWELSDSDFRRDEGGTPAWKFLAMMEAGESYLDLPVPRKLRADGRYDGPLAMLSTEERQEDINKSRAKAAHLLGYVSPELVSIMANTDVGIGTDPERIEQCILNKKKQVLQRKIFATCLAHAGMYETVEAVHAITEESQLRNGRKLDFGFAGNFEGVQLGFETAHETSKNAKDQRIIAIADLRFQWATTESRIHREKLYKYLTDDCKQALFKLEVPHAPETKDLENLAKSLSLFIEKYGTHVVLRCTHGYRLEKVARTTVHEKGDLHKFKAGMMASLLGYAGIRTSYQQELLKSSGRTENSVGVKNIGSIEHMKQALEGTDVTCDTLMNYASEEAGDAGVISHDWNMMIADVVASYSPTASKRLRYWTYVRINDLKAGWNEGLFSVSFQLHFKHWSSEDAVCVTIGGRTTVHKCPKEARNLIVTHITNVRNDEANAVQVSALHGLKLHSILSKITVFRRYLIGNADKDGLVLATDILVDRNTRGTLKRTLFSMETWQAWKQRDDGEHAAVDNDGGTKSTGSHTSAGGKSSVVVGPAAIGLDEKAIRDEILRVYSSIPSRSFFQKVSIQSRYFFQKFRGWLSKLSKCLVGCGQEDRDLDLRVVLHVLEEQKFPTGDLRSIVEVLEMLRGTRELSIGEARAKVCMLLSE